MFLGIINESVFSVYSHANKVTNVLPWVIFNILQSEAAFPLLFPKLHSYVK